jgi:hypothetical protein
VRAEFEREKKLMVLGQENEMQKVKRDNEERMEIESRAIKEKLDKQWKKRVDEVQQECDCRIDQI